MIEFFKRRWILLSCTLVLIACTFVDAERVSQAELTPEVSPKQEFRELGLRGGNFYRSYSSLETESDVWLEFSDPRFEWGIHYPMFGSFPASVRSADSLFTTINFPVSFFLVAVVGWIALREMAWRARAHDLSSTSNGMVHAFLKRRWILLSVLVVLVASSMLSWTSISYPVGLYRGNLIYTGRELSSGHAANWTLHRPFWGNASRFAFADASASGHQYLSVPLWSGIVGVIAWIVFRESAGARSGAPLKMADRLRRMPPLRLPPTI